MPAISLVLYLFIALVNLLDAFVYVQLLTPLPTFAAEWLLPAYTPKRCFLWYNLALVGGSTDFKKKNMVVVLVEMFLVAWQVWHDAWSGSEWTLRQFPLRIFITGMDRYSTQNCFLGTESDQPVCMSMSNSQQF